MTDKTIQDVLELSVLKETADDMGISYSKNIGVGKLRERIDAAMATSVAGAVIKEPEVVVKETEGQMRLRRHKEASALIRVRITCMNPNKREWQGEIFTVSNSVVGTFRSYVPFNLDEGWHIPQIILNQVKTRQCQIFKTVNGPRGEKVRKGALIPEFSIDVMTPLTQKELDELAQRQAMAGTIED
tara:strand:+ start:105 stop:662 length:558 start_codon:yes stop_codon:yes gene_type:complete